MQSEFVVPLKVLGCEGRRIPVVIVGRQFRQFLVHRLALLLGCIGEQVFADGMPFAENVFTLKPRRLTPVPLRSCHLIGEEFRVNLVCLEASGAGCVDFFEDFRRYDHSSISAARVILPAIPFLQPL